mgnify:CR=1 FL=1|tara:strand:+ start:231 stop:710 length:480 start_codon:yes stop_codon:yes gene_type:complete
MNYPIADYFTVFPQASDEGVTGECTFNIPASVFSSNAKGQYCMVSLADAGLRNTGEDKPIVISLANVLNSNDAVVGVFDIISRHNASYNHGFTGNKVQYLIPARPSQITVKTKDISQTAFTAVSQVYYTFKFEYLSKSEVENTNNETDYNVAFSPQTTF